MKVAFTVSDPFLISLHRDEFWRLIEGPVDLLFCNLEEARSLTGKHDPVECAREIHRHAENVALTLGPALIAAGYLLGRGQFGFLPDRRPKPPAPGAERSTAAEPAAVPDLTTATDLWAIRSMRCVPRSSFCNGNETRPWRTSIAIFPSASLHRRTPSCTLNAAGCCG